MGGDYYFKRFLKTVVNSWISCSDDWALYLSRFKAFNKKNTIEDESKVYTKQLDKSIKKNTLDFYLKKTDEEILTDFGITKDELSSIVNRWKSINNI